MSSLQPERRREIQTAAEILTNTFGDQIFFEILALLVALEAAEAEIERLRSPAPEAHGETGIEGGVTTVKARGRR